MTTSTYRIYKMVPMLIVMGTIFFISHKTGDEIQLPAFAYSDLVAHMLIYALLGGAVIYAWSTRFKACQPVRVVCYTVVFCLLYGISDEFHQSFVPGRYVSAMDVAADTVGAIIICTGWWVYSKKSFIYKSLR